MKNKLKSISVMLFALALMLSANTISAQVRRAPLPVTEIHFIEDAWNEALKQAAKQNKYIFVDAYATWCGPCKMLKATTFKDDKVAAFFNKNFINVSIDMEKGIGPQLGSQWQLQAYPTLIIFNPKGKAVLGTMGYMHPAELLKFGQQGLAKKG